METLFQEAMPHMEVKKNQPKCLRNTSSKFLVLWFLVPKLEQDIEKPIYLMVQCAADTLKKYLLIFHFYKHQL